MNICFEPSNKLTFSCEEVVVERMYTILIRDGISLHNDLPNVVRSYYCYDLTHQKVLKKMNICREFRYTAA